MKDKWEEFKKKWRQDEHTGFVKPLLHFDDIELFFKDHFISKKELPMGVSQWKNHGIKLGYWKYFEKDYISKKELQEHIDGCRETTSDGMWWVNRNDLLKGKICK